MELKIKRIIRFLMILFILFFIVLIVLVLKNIISAKWKPLSSGKDAIIDVYFPENGDLINKKGVTCNIPIDTYLPQSWSRNKE